MSNSLGAKLYSQPIGLLDFGSFFDPGLQWKHTLSDEGFLLVVPVGVLSGF